jgi:Mitochondrial carrier protein
MFNDSYGHHKNPSYVNIAWLAFIVNTQKNILTLFFAFGAVVSQAGRAASDHAYTGIIDCAVKVFREEGLVAFYRGLPPRLVSVVPMIGIQFGVNEFMRRVMLQRRIIEKKESAKKNGLRQLQLQFQLPKYGDSNLQEAMMEVAASQAHPYPVPRLPK